MPISDRKRSAQEYSSDTEPEALSRSYKKPKKNNSFLQLDENEEEEEEEDDDVANILPEDSMDEGEDELQESQGEDEDEDSPFLTQSASTRRLDVDAIDFQNMSINEAGTIARVEMVNFMCHKYLKIDLGPKINFIIGHNGSGKSAILTAITIALGANASSTNRGKTLSSFIKEGEQAASIVIHLTNRGENAYKRDIYPDIIVIERKITREGGSPYKIKNKQGHTKSNKKEDLIAILDHMNLLVNNPLTMLTQDMARKFLSDSSAEDKYKLFMHGTQLTQLAEDYQNIRENLDSAKKLLERKREGLAKLQADAAEAQKQYEDSKIAKEAETKIDELNNELVWAQIIRKEEEVEVHKEKAESIRGDLEQIQEAYDIEKDKVAQIEQKILAINEEWDAYKNQPNPYDDKKSELLEQKAELQSRYDALKGDLTQINNTIKKTKEVKLRREKELKAETDKLEASTKLKRNEMTEAIEKLKASRKDKIGKVNQFKIEQQDLQKEIDETTSKKQHTQHRLAGVRSRKEREDRLVKELEGQRGNRMKAYGPTMPEALRAIHQETRWEKRRPVGPFGATIELKHTQYADVIEAVLNTSLNAFVVESFKDKDLLVSILSRYNLRRVPVIVASYDLYDYTQGEPDGEYLTVLRALSFKDEWVKRQLIDANKIEKMLLMESRSEADKVMLRPPRNIEFCFTSSGHKVGDKQGMRTETLEAYRGAPRLKGDITSAIQEHRKSSEDLGREYREGEQEIKRYEEEIRELMKRHKQCKSCEYDLEHEIRRLEQQITDKEEAMKEDDPVDLNIFHEDIAECEEKIKSLAQQFQSIKVQFDKVVADRKTNDSELREIAAREAERANYSQGFREKIQKLENYKAGFVTKLDRLKVEKQTRKVRYEKQYSTYMENLKMVKEWIEQCMEEYPNRTETNRNPQDIEKEIRRLEALAEEREGMDGLSVDDLKKHTFEKLKAYQDAKDVVDGLYKIQRSIAKMLIKRTEKWEAFRAFIALAAKHYFSYYLHLRGDEGALRFNHETKTLEIRVSTGDQYSKGSRQKDSRSLSGGEKSFSQISLLLSLWQSISSPLICLDEFDVFMDAVNRKQTMGMIMNAACDNSSQYILITPQDASNMEPGPFVAVHRMADPERRSS